MEYFENQWPDVRLTVKPSGRAPKRYGADAFRFSAPLSMSVILPRYGWSLLKRTQNYAYFRSPEGFAVKSFEVQVGVPKHSQVEAITRQLYGAGESWAGQLGDWPAWYFHNRCVDMQEIEIGAGGYSIKNIEHRPPVSTLVMGEIGTWYVECSITEGNISFVGEDVAAAESANLSVDLVEGSASEVTLNKYERNKSAREACIAYYGCRCATCGLDFERTYGEIGRGFIHVHHITPISSIGSEYVIDPVHDLIPLCPNCHAMIHRSMPPMSVSELRKLIAAHARQI